MMGSFIRTFGGSFFGVILLLIAVLLNFVFGDPWNENRYQHDSYPYADDPYREKGEPYYDNGYGYEKSSEGSYGQPNYDGGYGDDGYGKSNGEPSYNDGYGESSIGEPDGYREGDYENRPE